MRIPRLLATATSCASKLPPGGRNANGVPPSASSMAFDALSISLRIRFSGRSRNAGLAGWSQEWFPTTIPASTSAWIRSGCSSTWKPIVKNVAFTWKRSRMLRIWGVYRGLGPSSNVSATAFGVLTGPETTPNAVALTFDDGPRPLYTPQILNILERFHVKATFFTIGFQVEEHPDLIQAEVDAGMVVGNHSWDHPASPAFRDLPLNRMRSEMLKASKAIEDAEGGTPFAFRPPGGSFDAHEVAVASSLGMRIVYWSVDPEDWRNDAKANEIVDNVLSHVHPGYIVIMHDGGGYQDATVKALPKIIRGIRAMGLGFATLTP